MSKLLKTASVKSKNSVLKAKELIENGSDPLEEDGWGNTGLELAAKRGNLEMAKLFLNHVAIDHCNTEGYMPILHAAESGHIDIIKYLLKNGANLDQQTKHAESYSGYAPIHFAIKNCDMELFNFLVNEGASTLLETEDDGAVVHLAAKFDMDDAVEYLLDEGIDPKSEDKNGITALDYAKESNSESVLILLDDGDNDDDPPWKNELDDLMNSLK